MQKIMFMANEFFRSFRKGLFKNILLMLMFSISFVMSVFMGSYYFDLGDRYSEAVQNIGDREWYFTEVMGEGEEEFTGQLTTVAGCRVMMDYYEALTSSAKYPFLSLMTQQPIEMREKDVKELFRDKNYTSFLDEMQPESFSGYFGPGTDGGTCLLHSMQSVQTDLQAYRFFGLRTQEGEGFTEENMTIREASDPIPIVMGSSYKGLVDVGDLLEVAGAWNGKYLCRVTGILEEDASVPRDRINMGEQCCLDSKILFPYGVRLREDPENVEDIRKFAMLDFLALENGMVQTGKGGVRDLMENYQRTGEKFGFPPVRLYGISMGMDLFRRESAATVRILLVLTVVLLCFTFYGLFITFYDKVQSNRRIYGIYLMNGCSLTMILLPCLLEIAVILLPSVLAGKVVFTCGNVGQFKLDVLTDLVCGLAGVAFLAGTVFICCLMRGVNTEHLIRQKE